MREDLIAYALGELDDDERERIEQALADDADLRDELEHLRRCLGQTEECQEAQRLPRGLADRTLAGCLEAESAETPAAGSLGLSAASGFMSPLDMTVAVGILFTIGSLLAPALYANRNTAGERVCANNLRSIGKLMQQYSQEHNSYYPLVRPYEHVGIFASRLREADYMPATDFDQLFVCPASPLAEQLAAEGRDFHVPSLGELGMAQGRLLTELKRTSSGSYGYQPGYYRYHHYQPARNHDNVMVPVMADAPSILSNYRTGANHDGSTVNVLFQDGCVRTLASPEVPRVNDHLFFNKDGQPVLGRQWNDAVIQPSHAVPGSAFEQLQMPEMVYRFWIRIE